MLTNLPTDRSVPTGQPSENSLSCGGSCSRNGPCSSELRIAECCKVQPCRLQLRGSAPRRGRRGRGDEAFGIVTRPASAALLSQPVCRAISTANARCVSALAAPSRSLRRTTWPIRSDPEYLLCQKQVVFFCSRLVIRSPYFTNDSFERIKHSSVFIRLTCQNEAARSSADS